MNSQLDRRGFLKLFSAFSLAPLVGSPIHVTGGTKDHAHIRQQPNVLILLFDAFSAKNASLHGYPRDTTPNLRRFAEKATVYHAHYAGGNFTSAGTAALLTGTDAWTNRGFGRAGTVAAEYVDRNLFGAFDGAVYTRMAYTHNLWVQLLLDQFHEDLDVNVDPGAFCLVDARVYQPAFSNDPNTAFQAFEEFLLRTGTHSSGSLLLGLLDKVRLRALMEMESRRFAEPYPRGTPRNWNLIYHLEDAIDGIQALTSKSPRPYLAYFHLLPPHYPYNARREFVGMFDDGWVPIAKGPHPLGEGRSEQFLNRQRQKYDEYIAHVDAEFGRLYDFMARTGVLDDTYVVVTSDHGEMFERGVFKHMTKVLYEPLIRIPLLVSKPGQARRQDVHVPTSCIDVLPTLLHATGQPAADWSEGELLPGFGQTQANSDRSIYVLEAKGSRSLGPLTKAAVALIKGNFKLIYTFGFSEYESVYELYDLQNDPEELEDLYHSKPSVAAELENELQQKLEEVNRPYSSA